MVKRLEARLAEGKFVEAGAAYLTAQSMLDRAVAKGVIKPGTAARKKSRLNSRLKAIAKRKKFSDLGGLSPASAAQKPAKSKAVKTTKRRAAAPAKKKK